MPELDLEQVLRDLPRPSFKRRLRESMQSQTVTPYITTRDVDAVVGFARDGFAAEEVLRMAGEAGGIHCEIRIGDSKVMIGGGNTLTAPPMPTMLHVYVRDVDALHRRALEAGGKELAPPRDQAYGDRDSVVEDAAGNQWCIATSKGGAYKPEALRDVTLYLHPSGVPDLLRFTEAAFGGETLERYDAPDGTVAHAKVRFGNSVVEMGEAHGQWAPMPTMIFFSVADADAAYARAMAAGARSIMAPKNQPYGRTGAVEDPAGNQWYMAGPVRT